MTCVLELEQTTTYCYQMAKKAKRLMQEMDDIIRFADFLWKEKHLCNRFQFWNKLCKYLKPRGSKKSNNLCFKTVFESVSVLFIFVSWSFTFSFDFISCLFTHPYILTFRFSVLFISFMHDENKVYLGFYKEILFSMQHSKKLAKRAGSERKMQILVFENGCKVLWRRLARW